MTIQRIHQEIKFRFNKINSNHKADFPPAYIDDAINKVAQDFVEMFYSGVQSNPTYNLGFEVTQQRMDMLQTLVVPDFTFTLNPYETNIYAGLITSLNQYSHFLRGYVIPEECNAKIPITIVRQNDLDLILNDSNQKPSLKWKRCLGVFQNNSLFVYTDFTPDVCKITYLKQPNKVFIGGYDSLEYINGNIGAYKASDTPISSDIPEQYHNILIDMVVQYLSSLTQEDPNLVKT